MISTDEAKRLLAVAKTLRLRVLLSLAYGCGLRAGDIDSAQTIIRIVQAKGRKDRHVMLPPDLLALLRQHDVAGDLAHRAERVLDDVGAGERAPDTSLLNH